MINRLDDIERRCSFGLGGCRFRLQGILHLGFGALGYLGFKVWGLRVFEV